MGKIEGPGNNTTKCTEPIRVLHVIGRLGSGGIEKLLVSLMENIDREQIAFDFLLSNKEKGFYDDYVRSLGANLLYVLSGNDVREKLLRRINLYKFLSSNDYTIVHLHGTQPQTYLDAFIAKIAGVNNIILHAHDTKSLTKARTMLLPVIKSIFRRCPTYYLACSQDAAEYMWPKRLSADKGSVLINGINFDLYTYSEEKRIVFRRNNHLDKKFVVGNIARFAEQKNHKFLLNVFCEVKSRIQNSELLLIGEGKMKEQISNMANQMGIGDSVIFYGTTKDIPSALMGMDVMCFPSFYEGLGIVALEAQAASLPVVVSDAVPECANISSYYHKLSLSDPIDRWASTVCSFYKTGGVPELPTIPIQVHNTTSK